MEVEYSLLFETCKYYMGKCQISLGVVNDQFSQIRTLNSTEEPASFVQMINTYLVDVETILSELTSKSDLPNADYSKLVVLVHKLNEMSSSIGTELVKRACADLIQACDQKNEQRFSQALGWMKHEFSFTKEKLESYTKMEQRILRVKNKQQN
ncbi:hypothetical protein UlMin_012293 [Ulmus minor]